MHISVNVPTLVIQLINFMILLVALKAVLYHPMVKAISDRQGRIKKELDEAEALNREAKALKDQYETKLREAHTEAAGIVAAANSEGERRKAELIEEGRREAAFLLEKGRTDLNREQQQAMGALREQVVDLSVDMASRLFRDAVSPDQHVSLVNKFLEKARTLNVG
ncbi:MAG: ATP synthase F0 subunit B [Proteobacteria bacterium]|nr:ATP synthase F0 subunit B [Pseudomonadota bacterium]